MFASQWFITTLKETPADSEIASHKLMLRTGMIRKLGSGLYTWMPLGLKVLRKVEKIVREEMACTGAIELLMPAVQPAELWQETKRWETFGNQLLKMSDNNGREYCFGPTHEEVITDIIRNVISSYKQLPLNLYQIQTKFRDEIRPRFGVMRAREFLMKDAYSFHTDMPSLEKTYQDMYQAYCNIFDRLGLHYRAVEADTGAIGGSASHEFQVLADSGEDCIFYSDKSTYAANVEQATYLFPDPACIDETIPDMQIVDTPNAKTIESVAKLLQIDAKDSVKTLIVKGTDSPMVALVLCGDDKLNPVKASKHPLIQTPLQLVDDSQIEAAIHAPVGSIGPLNLGIPVIVDHRARSLQEFVCGANINEKHAIHVVWERDANYTQAYDLREVQVGDISPDKQGTLQQCRGIEVGHIFQLGNKYSQLMKAEVLNQQGKKIPIIMGCYGLGIARIVAATIEQYNDENGIIWPESMAPFQLVIIPINYHRDEIVASKALLLYNACVEAGVDVLLDDRTERAGAMFADHDLIGIPHRIVISPKTLENNVFEYKKRGTETVETLNLEMFSQWLVDTIKV